LGGLLQFGQQGGITVFARTWLAMSVQNTLIDFPKVTRELVKSNFFECLDFALQFAPAGADEKDIRAKLAQIGAGAGKTFNLNELPLGHRLEIGLGMKEGKDRSRNLATEPKEINGWKLSSWFGDRAFYNGNWLLRGRESRHLRQHCHGSDITDNAQRCRRSTARRQQGQLHFDVRRW
jgi:hypothetical protein